MLRVNAQSAVPNPRMVAALSDFLDWPGTFTVVAERNGSTSVHKRVKIRFVGNKIHLAPSGARATLITVSDYQVTSSQEGSFTLNPLDREKSSTVLTIAREMPESLD